MCRARFFIPRTPDSICFDFLFLFFALVWLLLHCAQGLARTQELVEGSKSAVAKVLSEGKSEADVQVLKGRYSLEGCQW